MSDQGDNESSAPKGAKLELAKTVAAGQDFAALVATDYRRSQSTLEESGGDRPASLDRASSTNDALKSEARPAPAQPSNNAGAEEELQPGNPVTNIAIAVAIALVGVAVAVAILLLR